MRISKTVYRDQAGDVRTTYQALDDTGVPTMSISTVLIFQEEWRALTKPQQAALTDPLRARADVLTRLQHRGLLDTDHKLTLAGEAVLHWRPDDATISKEDR